MEITSVIKYEGDNSTFVWKHPKEDFNTASQLIVHETQEAIFFLNGQPLDLFGSGRYTLDTSNIPLLRKVIDLPTGGVSAFHCEVYFINKVEQMAIKWGTDSRVQYMEPTYGFPLSIGTNGEMSLRVEDSKKLLLRLVGTESVLSRDRLVSYFRAVLMPKIKSYLAQVIKAQRINIFEIDEHLVEFSDALRQRLFPDFLDYGVALERFFVAAIVKPEGEPQYERFKELHFRQYADVAEAKLRQQVGIIDQETEAQKRIIEAKSIAQKRATEGYTYQQERGFDVAEKLAENEGAGAFSSAGMGLGMMAGVGGAVGGAMSGAMNKALSGMAQSSAAFGFCDQCGAALAAGAAFCENCGVAVQQKPHCAQCSYVFERPGKFCPKCGAKREDVE